VIREVFGSFKGQDVILFTLTNKRGHLAKVMNYGATLVSFQTPDRNGKAEEVTAGFDTFEPYLTKSAFFGCTVGRFGNRIREGKFTLNNKPYQVPKNEKDAHHLHGGTEGFDKRLWEIHSTTPNSVTFSLTSPDGDQGYPGALHVQVTYTLTAKGELKLNYVAKSDAPTVMNLTNHTYFNLAGKGSTTCLGHKIQIVSDKITSVDAGMIPSGDFLPVKNTPFDFNRLTFIGANVNHTHEQMQFAGGYDHNWVVRGKRHVLRKAAAVHEPKSGRYLEVFTTEPAIQFYGGNVLDGSAQGHDGTVYGWRYGFCLETQNYPDAPNHPNFPSAVLNPGETFRSTTIYRFKTK
jgi:aldose 1-epimerase